MDAERKTLTIVLPALDEEAAIGSTIQRCLDAREHIVAEGGVCDVEVVVVSDGSSDRTEQIALGFEEVGVLAFERNRGYGAAIRAGFAHGRGDLVGFCDADGTCDPRFFADLCRAVADGADVALGSRMGPDSEMPRVRALGNTLFAWMLGLLSKRSVGDTASGMRVLRREALDDLDPLPDGLHFTPAMSARILLEDKLRLAELPMPYAERVGDSKLSVLRDGVRFLRVILQAVMCYRPARPLLLVAGALSVFAFALGIGPTWLWLTEGYVEEWMIYRVLLCSLLVSGVAILACGAAVAERIAALAGGRRVSASGVTGWLERAFSPRSRRAAGSAMMAAAVAVAWPGIAQYLVSGTVDLHWSRAVLAALLVSLTMVLVITTFLLNMLTLLESRLLDRSALSPPDRVRPARAGAR